MTVARQLSKKLAGYKYSKRDNNNLLYHILNKEAQDKAVFMKAERGIEVQEKINVELTINQFKAVARDFNDMEINNFLASNNFHANFRLEDGKIKTVQEI